MYSFKNSTPFTGKGFLWYQGEANSSVSYEHGLLFPIMIKAWRDAFNQGDLPFIFAQIASLKPLDWDLTNGLAWAYNRMSQRRGLLELNTDMITLHDAGEWEDNHPAAKQTVGYRFFMKARNVAYGEDIINSGPVYSNMQISGNTAIVYFKNVGQGLQTRRVSMPNQKDPPVDSLIANADSLHIRLPRFPYSTWNGPLRPGTAVTV